MRSLAIALLVLLVGPSVALANLTITGDKGTGPYTVSASGVITATGAVVHVGINRKCPATGFRWRNGSNSRWVGGLVDSDDTKETEWIDSKHCGGAGMLLASIVGSRIEQLRLDNTHDGVRLTGSSNKIVISRLDAYQVHDDTIESDNRSGAKIARLENSILKEVHTIWSVRRGNQATGSPPAVRRELVGNVIIMGQLRNSRDKRDYPWNPDDYGHGQLLKTELDGQYDTYLLQNNVIMETQLPKQAKGNHCVVPSKATIASGSGGNVYVWAGPQTAGGNGGIPMVSVPKLGGGTVMVPQTLCLHTTRLRAIFHVTDDPNYALNAERAKRASW